MTDETRLRPTRDALGYLRARGVLVSLRTLEEWRRLGRGPAVHRIGGRCYYAEGDLEQFLAASRESEVRP